MFLTFNDTSWCKTIFNDLFVFYRVVISISTMQPIKTRYIIYIISQNQWFDSNSKSDNQMTAINTNK